MGYNRRVARPYLGIWQVIIPAQFLIFTLWTLLILCYLMFDLQAEFLIYLLSIFLSHSALFDAFYMEQSSIYAGLIFFGMLFSPLEMILSVFMQIFSRKNEYEADRYAVGTTKMPSDMIDALKKLSRDNLSNLTPHPFYVFLKYSHPPVLERIRAIHTIG